MTASTPTRSEARSGGLRLAALAVVVAAVVLVYLTSRATPVPPFDIGSSAPDGYKALALLARMNGAEVTSVDASDLESPTGAVAAAGSVVVPLPSRLTDAERRAVDDLARAGVTVVLGTPTEPDGAGPEAGFLAEDLRVSARQLADTEAQPAAPGTCTVERLQGLGSIDAAFAATAPVPLEGRSCYGDGTYALVVVEQLGEGRVVTLGDPLLWANARLQPAKESGGQPLDNAAMALRLLDVAAGVEVAVVETTPSAGAPVTGTRDPVDLLPLPVKLALVQGAVALLLYLWWRGRRLGSPVQEPLPVEIAASELVVAVGDLLRRRGSVGRAAAQMRSDTRRELSTRLGVPPGSPPEVLVERVVARTGRPGDAVRHLLLDPPQPRDEDLVRLATELDSIRQEALDDQPVR